MNTVHGSRGLAKSSHFFGTERKQRPRRNPRWKRLTAHQMSQNLTRTQAILLLPFAVTVVVLVTLLIPPAYLLSKLLDV